MRFLPQTWAVSSSLHQIQHLPIIQWFHLWVELIPPIRKRWWWWWWGERNKKPGKLFLRCCGV